MNNIDLQIFLPLLSTVIFAIGLFGLMRGGNLIRMLLSIELMMLSALLNFAAFSNFFHDIFGQVMAVFVLSVAAAESATGLAILVSYYKKNGHVDIRRINSLFG